MKCGSYSSAGPKLPCARLFSREAVAQGRNLVVLRFACVLALTLAVPAAESLGQQPDSYSPQVWASESPATVPYADHRTSGTSAAPFVVRDPRPNDFQREYVHPAPGAADYPKTYSTGGQPWAGTPWAGAPWERLAQNPLRPEIIRPTTPMVPGAQTPPVPPVASQPPAEPAQQGIPSPFDVSPLETAPGGLPPGMQVPQPTAEVAREYTHFIERQINPENTIEVMEGRDTKLVLRETPRRVYIPNEKIASIQVVTDKEVLVVGNKVGTATLQLWFPDAREPANPDRDHILSYLVVVTPNYDQALQVQRNAAALEAQRRSYERSLKTLEKQIKGVFPDSAVTLSLVGNQLIVRGEVKDVVEAAEIYSLASRYAPSARGQRVPSQNMQMLFIPGMMRTEQEAEAAINFLNAAQRQQTDVINLLRVPGEQQVMLMVTVAEVNRTAARTIGVDFSIVKGGFAFAQTTGGNIASGAATAAGQTVGTASSAAKALAQVGGNLPTAIDNGNVLMAIQALRTLNFARSLAEPNLTTLNGRPANFQAGGSFPIPNSIVLPGGAAQSVTYQNFGVALEFTPYITDRDRIRLQLNASVSTPSTLTTEVSGAQVPSQITQRQFTTTVELREGQTLTVAGLLQNNFSGTSNRVPLWGDLPIIGRLGGVDSVSSGEQELVVLVTPVLVHPLDMCKTPPLPGNDVFEPGDVEFYLLGHLEGRRTEDYRTSVRTDFARQVQWCGGNDRFIIGPSGTTYGCCKLGICPGPSPSPCPVASGNTSPPTGAAEVIQTPAAQ